jgi:ankyrin repeat protein
VKILQDENVQMTTDEFWSRLHAGDSKVIQAMLSAGFPPNSEVRGMSSLMAAVRYYQGEPEKKEIVMTLVALGADVNYRDENNTTPFFYAAGTTDPDVLRAMIKAGATLEVTANGGATTLSEAVMANNVENVRLLLKSGYNVKKEPSWLLSTAKNPEIAKLLRSAGMH